MQSDRHFELRSFFSRQASTANHGDLVSEKSLAFYNYCKGILQNLIPSGEVQSGRREVPLSMTSWSSG